MYCTTCEMITEGVQHYKSSLHVVNIQRRSCGYTPLSSEEVASDVLTDDLIFDINHKHNHGVTSGRNNFPLVGGNKSNCLFCEQPETTAHYKEHGLSDEEITYIKRLQCPSCYERFVAKPLLLKHLEIGVHRTAVTDGQSLYLENGRILNPNRKNMEAEMAPLVKSVPNDERAELDPKYEEFLDKKRLEEYKCGLSKGRASRRTPF